MTKAFLILLDKILIVLLICCLLADVLVNCCIRLQQHYQMYLIHDSVPSLKERKKNMDLRGELLELEPVSLVIKKGRLRWFGRVECKDSANWVPSSLYDDAILRVLDTEDSGKRPDRIVPRKMKSLCLTQAKHLWRLRIRDQLTNPGLSG